MKLAKYKTMRNFKKTPEPKGKINTKKSQKNLYLIQKHAASHLHYDFRLELNGVLLSWAVPKGPCLDPNVKRLAIHVEDHPVEYGSFEGIIPKGQYGGGTVMLWDTGQWISEDENLLAAYEKGNMKFTIKGKKLNGLWKLFRINKDDKTWLLTKEKDKHSKNIKKYDVTTKEPNSVLSNKTMDEISEQYENIWKSTDFKKTKSKKTLKIKLDNLEISKIPNKFSPQLATLVDTPPSGKNWLHEIKFDGYRIIAIKKNGKTKLFSRNNIDWTSKFKSIAEAIDALDLKNIILDGELVILDKNRKSDFQALQNFSESDENNLTYYIFDLVYYDQYNLANLPLLKRKNILKKILPSRNRFLIYSDHFSGSGKDILNKACALSLEGIISKEATSTYISKRSKTWVKSKCTKRQEFVIGGFTQPHGMRDNFGALLLGTYNKKGKLIYNGNVGTGFTRESLSSLHTLFKKNLAKTNPFTSIPPNVKDVTWLKPVLIAEVEFSDWTVEGNLRHPSFKGLRADKNSKNVFKDQPVKVDSMKKQEKSSNSSHIFKLTNPDKILYPEDKISKKDIAIYYENIHSWILPYIKNRPLTLVRCPSGYKKCFYQKHITESSTNSLFSIPIKEKKGTGEYIYIKDKKGLFALTQMGALELHPWSSTIKKIEYPDMIIFDLDPSPEVKWKKVVEAAKRIKKYLNNFHIKCFVKTTGGKGLHIVIPIKPEYDWDEIKNFTKVFVDFLVKKHPEEYIGNMSKLKRKGKIFIDYLRNQRGATAIAPYSTRARIHATVSTPVDWNELTDKIEDTSFTIKTLPLRLQKMKKDPWHDFFTIKQSLKLIFDKIIN